ncbi:MAG TPA: amino acid ABC transporter permease [Candidatus Methylomirabilis sp.]|nr:amino acid ABC transporter permease [Candidatus Methylomirabilis sp.]
MTSWPALESTLSLLARGALVSLWLAAASIILGTVLAVLLMALAFSRIALARHLYRLYVWVVRGTPVLVQALLVFYALPALDLRTGPYVAGVLVLTLYLGALIAEVIRGGVLAIPRPQWDSARSLGLPPGPLLRRVVAPLVVRYALPPYVNVCVMAVKASSVLSIISVWELTFAAREIIERTLAVFSVLGLAALFYFIMCFGIDRLGRYAEGRLALKGFAGEHA